MEKLFIFLLVATGSFCSCNLLQTSNMDDYIPGMYVRPIDHEFAAGGDTLVVTHLQENIYQIVKRSGFWRTRNGKQLPYEHKVETWTAIYDEASQTLHEARKGKVLTPLPRERKLLLGASSYQKVNL